MSFWRSFALIPSHLFANRWLQAQQKSILSAAGVITAANILVSATGLLRDRLMLAHFAGEPALLAQYDAFRVAFQVPDMVFNLLVIGALSAAFVPIFTGMKKKSEKAAFEFANVCMNYLLLFFLLAAALVMIFAGQITSWRIGEAYTSEQVEIVIGLTRLMLLGQLFFAVSSFFAGIQQSYQRFIVPALVPVLYNGGIVLGTYLLFPVIGVYAAGVGVVMGAFLHMLAQYPFVHRLNWRYRFDWNWQYPGVQKLFALMPARTLTLGMSEVQNFGLAYFITSVVGIGYSVFALARSLIIIPIRFVGVPIGQASLPFLADLSDEASLSNFKKIVIQSLNQIAYLACPLAVLLLILRIPVVRLVFGTRNFPWELTVMTGRMVALMAISIPMQAMFHLLVRAFHALRDTVTPFLIAIFITCVFFIGAAVSVQLPENQLYGIAITISVAAFAETLLFLAILHYKIKKLITFNFVVTQLKIYLISGMMAVGLYVPLKLLDTLVFNTARVIPLLALTGITAVVGLSVYILLSKVFRIQEMQILISIFRNFRKKPKKEVVKLLNPPTELIRAEVDNDDIVA